jgi:MGT family glycosyltransferase
MARILVGSVPVIGHVNPLLPLVRALARRGHELRWYTGAKYRAKVEAAGARHAAMQHARDYDDAAFDDEFPERRSLSGLAQLKFDMKQIFIGNAPGQLRDLQAITREFHADVLLCEPTMLGALFHSELSGVPTAVLGVMPLVRSSRDTAPFGLGLAPDASALGRLRNRALNWAVEHVLFRDVQARWNEVRKSVGLPPTGWWLDAGDKAAVYMQPSIPSLEHPRSDLPRNVHFIGIVPPEAPSGWNPPDFWPELDGARPIVHVTQGTIANQAPDLIAPALEGLAGEDVLVVVTTGGRPVASLGLRNVPNNARIGTFLSYPELLPKTSAMVTNGGYGGVQNALSYGVPLVVAGVSEDKPEVAMRVACSGAGISLKTAAPSPERVRGAVRMLLDDPRYRTRARALAAEYARYDAIALGVERVEGTAARSLAAAQ